MKTNADIIKFIEMVISEHKDYWDKLLPEMKRYRDSYESKFWTDRNIDKSMIQIETADCYSYIEGFISSLFTKNPAVVIARDVANPNGNAKLAQETCNRWLFEQRTQLEIASRLALIYPNSCLKISPRESEDMLDKVAIRAIPPWEIIVDQDASSWNTQRFCGHTYYLPLNEANDKYGYKKWIPTPKRDYFETERLKHTVQSELPNEYLYIQIIELYDFVNDKLYIWTPNLKDGLLQKDTIPLRTYDEQPLAPISPLYYSRKPEKPLCGISAVSRVYDQFYEKNILRTYWANAIRRDSRQYIYKEGAFDPEELAKITAGIDGAMIACDEPNIGGLIMPIGVEPISGNFDRYLGQIESDINRGTILAPFSRGETTGVTATEISALAQYSSSQLGKLARERDIAIEQLATIYLRTVSLMAEEGEKTIIEVDEEPKVITVADLDAKFKIIALDQASTPISSEIAKQNLMNLLPVLTQLGIDQEKIKEEVIRLFNLPKTFLEPAPAPEAPPQAAPAQPQAAGPTPEQLQMMAMTGGLG